MIPVKEDTVSSELDLFGQASEGGATAIALRVSNHLLLGYGEEVSSRSLARGLLP